MTPTEHMVEVAPGVQVRILAHHLERDVDDPAHDRDEQDRQVPFLLVHGLASNARLWDGVAEALAAAGHPVVAVDQRGHGRSSKPDHGYDFATIVADLVSLVEWLGWERPVVVGQSWGGNVVIELGATHPELAGAIVAVDGGFIELSGRFDSWDQCRVALAPPHLVGTPVATMERWMRDGHPSWPESGILGSLANFEVRPDGTIAPWLTFERHMMILEALYGHRPSMRYPQIVVPTLLVPADTGDVAWTHDKRDAVDAALASLPDGRVRWFSPADHDIHAQHPVELAEVLLDLAREGSPR
jgi:pimeloyl-ACP methyl ester carboxylesterase